MELTRIIAALGVCLMLIVLGVVVVSSCIKSEFTISLGVSTVDHEGHSYVVCRSWQGVAMVHDPECRVCEGR